MSERNDDEDNSGLTGWLGISGESGRLKSWMIAAAVVSIALFTAVIWYAYKSGEETRNPPPVVTADESPVKVRPEEPGGEQVADQDKLVLNGHEGEEAATEDKLLPAAEEPVARAPAAEEAAAPPPLPAVGEETEEAPAAAPAEPAPEAPALSGLTAVEGDYLIQLGAFGSRERAERAWGIVRDKFADVVAGLDADIFAVDVPGRGTLYRLRAGPLFDRAEADKLCAALKDRGQGCIVAKP